MFLLQPENEPVAEVIASTDDVDEDNAGYTSDKKTDEVLGSNVLDDYNKLMLCSVLQSMIYGEL